LAYCPVAANSAAVDFANGETSAAMLVEFCPTMAAAIASAVAAQSQQ
jgi:hypothetical protein